MSGFVWKGCGRGAFCPFCILFVYFLCRAPFVTALFVYFLCTCCGVLCFLCIFCVFFVYFLCSFCGGSLGHKNYTKIHKTYTNNTQKAVTKGSRHKKYTKNTQTVYKKSRTPPSHTPSTQILTQKNEFLERLRLGSGMARLEPGRRGPEDAAQSVLGPGISRFRV